MVESTAPQGGTPSSAAWPRHVLVLRAGAIGDFILTLPALAALRHAFPSARLALVGNPQTVPLALSCGYADAAHSVDEAWVARLFEASTDLPADVRGRLAGVDLAVVWLRSPDGPVIARLRSLGVRTLAAPSFPAPNARLHVADHLRSTLLPLGIPPGEASPRLDLTERDRALADALWERHGLCGPAPVVAVHPGSGGPRKNWPPERFAAVADRLAEAGARVLLVAGPADEGPAAEVRRLARLARPVDVRGADLIELAAVLARCAGFVGNDSGVSHLAAAVGAPAVAIFGPTDPAVWAPRGERVTVLWKGVDCSPCGREAALACSHRRCLGLVGVDEVARAVEALL